MHFRQTMFPENFIMRRSISAIVVITFLATSITPIPKAQAQGLLGLPEPGTMVSLSAAYQPAIIKGITVHKDNPFLFDFLVDVGQDKMQGEQIKAEGDKLIKYFMATLAIPEKDLWVNLSPYEKDRTVPEALGQTDMGRDLLAQDYILKQLTASLIYPEKELGKKFWDRIYGQIQAKYGNVSIPVNTFNKVWIMADKAEVYEHNQTAFVTASHLKVMLEEDYLATQKNVISPPLAGGARGGVRSQKMDVPPLPNPPHKGGGNHELASQVIREIIIPELEKEINTGKNFANLRQIFNSIILASWYKKNLKQSLLNEVYSDKAKVKGIDIKDKTIKQQIYQRYLQAYKRGVFNYIKDTGTQGVSEPRKYFSGGILVGGAATHPVASSSAAMIAIQRGGKLWDSIDRISAVLTEGIDRSIDTVKRAMLLRTIGEALKNGSGRIQQDISAIKGLRAVEMTIGGFELLKKVDFRGKVFINSVTGKQVDYVHQPVDEPMAITAEVISQETGELITYIVTPLDGGLFADAAMTVGESIVPIENDPFDIEAEFRKMTHELDRLRMSNALAVKPVAEWNAIFGALQERLERRFNSAVIIFVIMLYSKELKAIGHDNQAIFLEKIEHILRLDIQYNFNISFLYYIFGLCMVEIKQRNGSFLDLMVDLISKAGDGSDTQMIEDFRKIMDSKIVENGSVQPLFNPAMLATDLAGQLSAVQLSLGNVAHVTVLPADVAAAEILINNVTGFGSRVSIPRSPQNRDGKVLLSITWNKDMNNIGQLITALERVTQEIEPGRTEQGRKDAAMRVISAQFQSLDSMVQEILRKQLKVVDIPRPRFSILSTPFMTELMRKAYKRVGETPLSVGISLGTATAEKEQLAKAIAKKTTLKLVRKSGTFYLVLPRALASQNERAILGKILPVVTLYLEDLNQGLAIADKQNAVAFDLVALEADDQAMSAVEIVQAGKMKSTGGIDLKDSSVITSVHRDGMGVEFAVDRAMIERVRREGIESLTPVILRIEPAVNIWPLLGLTPPVKEEERLAGA